MVLRQNNIGGQQPLLQKKGNAQTEPFGSPVRTPQKPGAMLPGGRRVPMDRPGNPQPEPFGRPSTPGKGGAQVEPMGPRPTPVTKDPAIPPRPSGAEVQGPLPPINLNEPIPAPGPMPTPNTGNPVAGKVTPPPSRVVPPGKIGPQKAPVRNQQVIGRADPKPSRPRYSAQVTPGAFNMHDNMGGRRR